MKRREVVVGLAGTAAWPFALLREHKLASPTKAGLVFSSATGNVLNLVNVVEFGLKPAMIRAGLTKPMLDSEGKPVIGKDGRPDLRAKYTGFHALRHFYASWCINSEADGGLGLPSMVVQRRLGHSSIMMTMDVYGHLFPRGDYHAEQMGAAERALLA